MQARIKVECTLKGVDNTAEEEEPCQICSGRRPCRLTPAFQEAPGGGQGRTGAQRSSGWPGAHMGVLTSRQRIRREHGELVVAAEDTGLLTCARQPSRGAGAHMSVLAVPPSESDMSMVSLWLR